jgi:hypothetical protein
MRSRLSRPHWPVLCSLLCATPTGARAQTAEPQVDAGPATPEPTPAPAAETGPGPGSDSGSGSGSDSGSGSGSGSDSDSGSDSGSGAGGYLESEAEAAADDAALAASREELAQRRVFELQRALQEVRREREDSSLLLPWLVTSAGIAMAAVGIGVGLSDALCDDTCTGPFWASWLVMAGATAGTAGGLWLTLEQHDRTELRRRHERIQREIQYLEWSTAPTQARGARAAFGSGIAPALRGGAMSISLRLKF